MDERFGNAGVLNGAAPHGGSLAPASLYPAAAYPAGPADPHGGDPPPAPVALGMVALRDDQDLCAAVRREVEGTTASYAAIARRFGLKSSGLHRYAQRHGWARPEGARRAPAAPVPRRRLAATIEDAGQVVERLLRAVDRQVGKIDARLRRKGAEIEEKDARILGHLAKTLQTVMALDRDDGATAKEPVDREELDADLARRINRWAAGGEED